MPADQAERRENQIQMNRNRRYQTMDLFRVLSFAVVVFYHFFMETYQYHKFGWDIWRDVQFGNINIVVTAVSMFFMVSGAGLTFSCLRKEGKIDWWTWYMKHFLHLMIPFYLAYILTVGGTILATRSLEHFQGKGLWRIIFTLIGMDGYLSVHGVGTFYLAVGEWFFGCLVVFYLLYPLLFRMMQKYGSSIMAGAAVLVLAFTFWYHGDVPLRMLMIVKIFDFLMGIYLAIHAEKLQWIPAVILACISLLLSGLVHIPVEYASSIFAACLLATGLCMEPKLPETVFSHGIRAVAEKWSFEIFLLHHALLLAMVRMIPEMTGAAVMVGLAGYLVVVIIFAGVLRVIEKLVFNVIKKD